MTRAWNAHEVSKASVSVAKRNIERNAPMIIVAPHRGHAHEVPVAGSGGGVAVAGVEVAAAAWWDEQRPGERHAGHATGVREKA